MVLHPVVEDNESPPSQSPSPTVSRFSVDSFTEAAKPTIKTSLMTVRSIKKLWRKSNNKSSISFNTPPRHQVPPVRPERPFEETIELPDVQLDPPPLAYSFQDQSRPLSTQDRPLMCDQLNVPQSKQMTVRQLPPSFAQGTILVTHPLRRNESTLPIVTAQLPPQRTSATNRFQFDQESPYPVHMSNSPSSSPAQVPLPPSPAVPATVSAHLQQSSLSLEKDKLTGSKPILRAFQKSKQVPVLTQSRLSIDKSSHQGLSARPSFHSVQSSVHEIPFLGGRSKTGVTSISSGDRVQLQSRSATWSTDSANSILRKVSSGSPPLSMGFSSRSSIETRPSSEASQVENGVFYEPSTLTYPSS